MMTFRQWAESHQLGDLPDVVYRYAEAAWQASETVSSEEIKRLKAKLVPQDERAQEIKRLLAAQAAERERAKELVEAIKAASNYIDMLGGDSKEVRIAIAKYEGESNEP